MSPVVRGSLFSSLTIASIITSLAWCQVFGQSPASSPAQAPSPNANAGANQPATLCTPTVLGSFVDKLTFTGWQSLPLYTWQGSPVAVAALEPAAAEATPSAVAPAKSSGSGKSAGAPGVVPFKNVSSDNVPAGVAPPVARASVPAPVIARSHDMFGQTEPKIPDFDPLKATILGEYSLRAYTRKVFQRGQRFITVNLYEFAGTDSAFAAYYFLRRGATTVVKRGDATSEDDDSISFVQGRCFVLIQGSSTDDDESKDVVREIAGEIAKAIPERGDTPYILSMMPRLEFLRGSEKLVMGQASARRFCPAPSLSALDFKNCRLGCVADYQMREPVKERLKLLYLDYGNNFAAATASYQSYIRTLCESRDEDPEPRMGVDSNQFRNGSTYIEVQLRGARLVMVSGARKKYSADLLLRQVR